MSLQYGNIDAAIAQAEGFNTAGSIPNLANNPGDIIASPFATAHGAKGSITAAGGQQIAAFPDAATGYAATDALVASKVASGSVTDINSLAQSWLGSNASPTDVSNYAATLSNAIGVPSSTPVANAGSAAPSATGATPAASLTSPSTWGPALQSSLGLSAGRVGAFVVGLIFIAGGIMMLKPAQSVVVNAGRAATSVV